MEDGRRNFRRFNSARVGAGQNYGGCDFGVPGALEGPPQLVAAGCCQFTHGIGIGGSKVFRRAVPQKMDLHSLSRKIAGPMAFRNRTGVLLAIVLGCTLQSFAQPRLAGCAVFPADNVWNTPIDKLPLDANSARYIAAIGSTAPAHPDFGSGLWDGGPIGIPFIDVPGTQPKITVTFDYSDESDGGGYPVPANPPIEGGASSTGDRHVLIVDRDHCILYELYNASPQPDGSWHAGSGAIFDLKTNALRPAGWTSADAAGLPIAPGLVRYDEVAAGEVRHAIRFTAPRTRNTYVWPGRHYASSLTAIDYPPMGQRFRLKAGFDMSGFS